MSAMGSGGARVSTVVTVLKSEADSDAREAHRRVSEVWEETCPNTDWVGGKRPVLDGTVLDVQAASAFMLEIETG